MLIIVGQDVLSGRDEQGCQRRDEQQQPGAARVPPLDPDRPGPLGQQAEEFAVQVTALLAEHPPQLRGQGEPAGGRESLGDLLDGELAQGAPVDQFSA